MQLSRAEDGGGGGDNRTEGVEPSYREERGALVRRNCGRRTKKDLHMFGYMKFKERKPVAEVPGITEEDGNDDDSDVDSDDKELSHKEVFKHLLHSKPIHLTIIGLVVLETIFLTIETLIDVKVIRVGEHSVVPSILHGFSIAILFVFVLEIAGKLYVDRRHFIEHKFDLFDAIIVVISFALNIVTAVLHEDHILQAVTVIVFFRLWRVFRVINGIIMTVKDRVERQVKVMELEMEKLRIESEKKTEMIREQIEAIEELVFLLEERSKCRVEGEFIDRLMFGQQKHV